MSTQYNNTPPHLNRSIKNLCNQRFGRLHVLGYAGCSSTTRKQRIAQWLCRCDCGTLKIIAGTDLLQGKTTSCKCGRGSTVTHGQSQRGKWTPEFRAYSKAKERCSNPTDKAFHNYGGRGIEVKFQNFEAFFNHIGKRPSRHYSLDRINVNGHYEAGNVRWATRTTQTRNKRTNRMLTFNGRTQCIAQWSEETSISPPVIHYRIKRHWCIPCTLSIMVDTGSCPHKS